MFLMVFARVSATACMSEVAVEYDSSRLSTSDWRRVMSFELALFSESSSVLSSCW